MSLHSNSAVDTERHRISRLPDGKWLYRDQNHAANKGNALNFLQAHGVNSFREAANALSLYTQPEKSAAATPSNPGQI